MKQLLILPGAGDSHHPSYTDAYDLLLTEARKRKYDDVQIQAWVGQASHEEQGYLNFADAVNDLTNTLNRYEQEKKEYDVICRSYGCSVFMESIKLLNLTGLQRAVLWGPSGLYNYYRLFVLHEKQTTASALKKGVKMDRRVFNTVYPFELHIKEFNEKYSDSASPFRLKIATGEFDEQCSPSFVNFLENGFGKSKITYQTVPGVTHVVREYNKEYLNALFDEF